MGFDLITKIFGSKHDRDIKKLQPLVAEINDINETLKNKPDDWFTTRTEEFKTELKPVTEQYLAQIGRAHV